MFARGLRGRTALFMASTLALSLLLTAIALILPEWFQQRGVVEQRGRDFAQLATPEICKNYEAYFDSGYFKFRELTRGTLSHSPDVVRVRISDIGGRVLFDSLSLDQLTGSYERSVARQPDEEERIGDPDLLEAVEHLDLALLRGPRSFVVVSPYVEDWGRHRLSVVYDFSYAELRAGLIRQVAVTGALVLIGVLAALFVGMSLMSRITGPLERLTDGVRAIAHGRFDARSLGIETGNEIQVLAEAFEQMAVDLEATLRRLEDTNRSLASTNEELESKNAELERFAYTVSHDLKSPLVTIRAFLGHIERHAETGDLDRHREDLERVRKAAIRMQRLLEELLSLSRVGRVQNPHQTVELTDLVRQAVEQVTGQLEETGATVEIGRELPAVTVDAPRIAEVLQNLLENAAKFSAGVPNPRIEVGARREDDQSILFVRDNGVGIEPRFQSRVFGLFEQLDPGHDGTGLGLALAKRIIEVHRGRIWIESDGPGKGTTVCFTLPEAARDVGPGGAT